MEWGEYRLGDLFESSNGDFDIQKTHINGKGDFVITSGLGNNGVLGKSNIPARIFSKGTITVDMFGNVFYRQYDYKMVTHARVFSIKLYKELSVREGIFLSNSLFFLSKVFSYENMCSWEKIKDMAIQLPTRNGDIDFDFMETFIAELEAQRIAELEAYLTAAGLKDCTLTAQEEEALRLFEAAEWEEYNLEKLYGKSTRGKRLKSSDRIAGNLPFVTAGEADEGISAFIGNSVEVFAANTTTIDMFGSAKYRNYEYGGDDHVAVVHTENVPKMAAIFITTAIHKASHCGQFDYSRNFYAKDADALNIMLPCNENRPDYAFMQTFISAIQKLVIQDVAAYSDRKMAAARQAASH